MKKLFYSIVIVLLSAPLCAQDATQAPQTQAQKPQESTAVTKGTGTSKAESYRACKLKCKRKTEEQVKAGRFQGLEGTIESQGDAYLECLIEECNL